MRKEKKYNYIYKTTCNVTNKYYVGMHSTDDLNDGYMGSGKRLWFSMNYHGRRNHSIEVLEYYDTRTELREREADLVNEDLLKEDLCMNLKTGGDGGFVNEEHRQKFITSDGPKNFAIRLKEDKEFREEHRELVSNNMKKAHANGSIKYDNFKGKSHTDDTKRKMSELMKGKHEGKNNPSYGSCWIMKDDESKKIKKEDLNGYLELGWIKGRKMKH